MNIVSKFFLAGMIYYGIGMVYTAIHCIVINFAPMRKILGWFFLADVDLPMVGDDLFKNKWFDPLYVDSLVYIWPVRVAHIFGIFFCRIIFLVGAILIIGYCFVLDFFKAKTSA